MEIRLAKTAGFCFGVDRAVKLTYGLLDEGRKVATLGPLIHNPQTVEDLERRGALVADTPADVPTGYEVVIRSHGVPRSIYDELEARGCTYHDATCPFVKKIQKIASEAEAAGAVCVRGTKEEVSVIDDTVKKCQEGGTLLLFPEGTREQEGKFLPLKSGLFVIAAAANVDVVPCRIYYDTPDGKMKLFCKVRVIFGEPMPAAQFAMEGRRDIKKLRENKQAVLDAWSEL